MSVKKRIGVTKENREFIAKAFGVTTRMVWKALAFQSDTDLARRIRTLALERGGNLVEEYVPNCETTFQETEKAMTCAFGTRVKLVVDRNTNNVAVHVDGKQTETYNCECIADFMQLQYETQQMAAAL